MKQNPCRYCFLSVELRGHYCCSFAKECAKCENRKKHEEYLESQRKFKPGEPITDISEFLQQTWVIFFGKTKHIEVFKSMPLRVVLKWIESGVFRKAIKKESEAKCSDETGSNSDRRRVR